MNEENIKNNFIKYSNESNLIPEIRVLPMSKMEFSTILDCRKFLTIEMPKRGNTFYYRSHKLKTLFNSLILFQCHQHQL